MKFWIARDEDGSLWMFDDFVSYFSKAMEE